MVHVDLIFLHLSMIMIQDFQDSIAPIQDDVNRVNKLVSQFRMPGIQLSPDNLKRSDDLNRRWRLLQVYIYIFFKNLPAKFA